MSFQRAARRNRGRSLDSYKNYNVKYPENLISLGYYDYSCQDELICKVEMDDVPYFNAPIYSEGKVEIGKIDEIFGNPRNYWITIKLSTGVKKSNFKKNQKLFIDSTKLLPLQRFFIKVPGLVEIIAEGGSTSIQDKTIDEDPPTGQNQEEVENIFIEMMYLCTKNYLYKINFCVMLE
ncbi:hypothetical protein FQA39_LY17868 [Lamprigera yunnana]|nr:hypothetical protein FQA39_LY17868 [Lamprigera yunnana]